jgi:acetolactate synthase I/II/III large subunit
VQNKSLTGAEWLSRSIAAAGIDHVFFMDAMARYTLIDLHRQSIRTILAHSEKGAAYMADGYARITNRPAICFGQSVGAANLAAGLQDAWLARSPVIALTGRKAEFYQYRNSYQEIPHQPLFSSVTKFSANVITASELPRLFRQAWTEAVSGTPRPTHLDLAGLAGEVVELGEVSEQIGGATFTQHVPAHRPVAAEEEIDNAVALLSCALRPVIIAGTGAVASGAGHEILTLAERLHIPVGTSVGGYGLVPTGHHLFIGTVGNYAAPPSNKIVFDADLVFYIGCHTGDQVTLNWQVPQLNTKIIQIDIDGSELGRSYPDTLGLHGDPKSTLRVMLQKMSSGPGSRPFAESAAGVVRGWKNEIAPFIAEESGTIRVERLCAEITRALPNNGVLVADTGYASIWTCTMVGLNGDGQTYLRAAGSLGWAFPAALGVKCGAPNRPVICFIGDGGLYYHLSELETARRYNVPIVVVVNNNSGFAQSISGVRKAHGNSPGDSDGLGRFGPLDFSVVAKSFGIRSVRVERAADLAKALHDAVGANETVLVDVVTGFEPRAPVGWVPDLQK